MQVMFPDYNRCILNLAASILHHLDLECPHAGLPEADAFLSRPRKNRVMMILDGLGSACLQHMLPEDGFLRQHQAADISSVYPCTTAAATTTLLSGLSPLEHGWLGWNAWFCEFGRIVDLFLDRDSYSGAIIAPSPAKLLLPYADISQRLSQERPGFLRCHKVMPPFDPNGVDSLARMAARIREICALDGPQLILAYWHEPDTLMHNEGPGSDAVRQDLRQSDQILADLYRSLEDVQILITADHGQIAVEREIYLDDYPLLNECLILPPSLESRAASLFVKPEKMDYFAAAFRDLFGDCFLLLPRSEVFERGLFGPGKPHRKVDDFVGSYLACATGQAILRYRSLFNRPRNIFKGHHAGLCADEMTVPLILAEK